MTGAPPDAHSPRRRRPFQRRAAALIAIVLVGIVTQAEGRVVFEDTPLTDGPGWVFGWNPAPDHCRRAPLLRAERAQQRSVQQLQTLRRTADGRYGYWIEDYPVWDRFAWGRPVFPSFIGPAAGCGFALRD